VDGEGDVEGDGDGELLLLSRLQEPIRYRYPSYVYKEFIDLLYEFLSLHLIVMVKSSVADPDSGSRIAFLFEP
jgi:hypothetical protein